MLSKAHRFLISFIESGEPIINFMFNVFRIIAGLMMILGGLGNLVTIGGKRASEQKYYWIISIVFFLLGAALIIVGYKGRRKNNNPVAGSE